MKERKRRYWITKRIIDYETINGDSNNIQQKEMEFLKQKFFDEKNYIHNFLDHNNSLQRLESNDNSAVPEEIKKAFVSQFTDRLIEKNVLDQTIINAVTDLNPWSIDFPSWHGVFDVKKGKEFFIVGSEPHIQYKYLQTVYGFHNHRTTEEYLNIGHPIFRFIADILSHKYNIPKIEVLKECYLTDLFPLSPCRGNGLKVGTASSLQRIIGDKKWEEIRFSYARENLPIEIQGVKPKLIITQGMQVFYEVIKILGIEEKRRKIPVQPIKGRKQYIRSVSWNNIEIISVPHIGSRRTRTFWNNNIGLIKEALDNM